MFQILDYKENHFLDLLDKDHLPIKPTYIKSNLWLKLLSHFNSLYARATRAITNHAPIGKYRLRFFSKKKEFKCLYRMYLIEFKYHILYNYKRFNNYWNPDRVSL